MNYVAFIWKNMVRNRRRTLLTILSIALSLFVLSTLMTVLTELNREPEGEDTHLRLVVRRASSLGDPLPEAYAAKLKRVPGVRMISALTWFGGIYIDEGNFFANFASDPDTLFSAFPENRIPPAQLEAFQQDSPPHNEVSQDILRTGLPQSRPSSPDLSGKKWFITHWKSTLPMP